MKKLSIYPVLMLFALAVQVKSCAVSSKACESKLDKPAGRSTKYDALFSYDNHFYKI